MKHIHQMSAEELWNDVVIPWWDKALRDPESILYLIKDSPPTLEEVKSALKDYPSLAKGGKRGKEQLYQVTSGQEDADAAYLCGIVLGMRMKSS